MINKLKIVGIVLAIFAICFVIVGQLQKSTSPVLGSVSVGNEYNATTTRSFNNTALPSPTLIKTGSGTLGSVIVTGAATGEWRLYDATTTNVSLRTGQAATSTLTFISFPASLAAGTYTFDMNFNTGLLYDFVGGVAGTSTITFR